jgi:hypothetical protein
VSGDAGRYSAQAIADLEQAVGARLLDRGPHRVAPTVYGDIVLKRHGGQIEPIGATRKCRARHIA